MAMMYIARYTRPDILMPITYLASHSSQPTVHHIKAAFRVLRYLGHTKDYTLNIKPIQKLILKSDVDASHHLHVDALGHSGSTFFLGDDSDENLILARSNKQKLGSRSTSDAEMISVDDNCTYIVWIRFILSELGFPQLKPTPIGQDNLSAIHILQYGGTFKRTKHLVGRFTYIRERLAKKEIIFVAKRSVDMTADFLTKPLSYELLIKHCKSIGLLPYKSSTSI